MCLCQSVEVLSQSRWSIEGLEGWVKATGQQCNWFYDEHDRSDKYWKKAIFFALFFLSNGSSHISGRPHLRPVIKKKVPIAKNPGKAINFKRTLSHSGNQTEEVCEALDETLIASLLSAWPFADPPRTPLKGARGLRWPALGSRWSKVGVMWGSQGLVITSITAAHCCNFSLWSPPRRAFVFFLKGLTNVPLHPVFTPDLLTPECSVAPAGCWHSRVARPHEKATA